MEPLDKPVTDKVMHAMAQAFPDPVDIVLLSMVLGCDPGTARAATAGLLASGLAQGSTDHPCITDRGMAVAFGLAPDAEKAAALLDRLEAQTLRALLSLRVRGSRLAPLRQAELCASLLAVPDGALVDAARVWAHQPVSDWRALIRVLLGQDSELAAAAAD